MPVGRISVGTAINLNITTPELGFEVDLTPGAGGTVVPRITKVLSGYPAHQQGVTAGMTIQRMNNLDVSMLTEAQLEEQLNVRPAVFRIR